MGVGFDVVVYEGGYPGRIRMGEVPYKKVPCGSVAGSCFRINVSLVYLV